MELEDYIILEIKNYFSPFIADKSVELLLKSIKVIKNNGKVSIEINPLNYDKKIYKESKTVVPTLGSYASEFDINGRYRGYLEKAINKAIFKWQTQKKYTTRVSKYGN